MGIMTKCQSAEIGINMHICGIIKTIKESELMAEEKYTVEQLNKLNKKIHSPCVLSILQDPG